jgi:murein DD-endopeptidase MepM/ murein hydrolase activator NlpD
VFSRSPILAFTLAVILLAVTPPQGRGDDSAIAPQGFFARLFHSFPSVSIAPETSAISADGFDYPVAPPDGVGFCKSRGFRAHGHLGEDWVIAGGKGQAFGDPVDAIGNGQVVLARDIRADWGNVVVIRHAWIEDRKIHFADSLYGHLDRIMVREGQQIKRGQQIGTIGNNHGMYPPHLHFEIHKDLAIGVNHAQGTRDLRSYWVPTDFIENHRTLHGGGRAVPTPATHFLLPTAESPWSFHRLFFHPQKKKKSFTKESSAKGKGAKSKSGSSKSSNDSSETTHHSKKKHKHHGSSSSSDSSSGSGSSQ